MRPDLQDVQNALRAWVASGSGLPLSSVYWGQQDSARVVEPAIEMRVLATNPVGLPWLDMETNYVALPTLTVTAVDATSNQLTSAAHGYNTGDGPLKAVAGSGALPGGLAAATAYWVIRVDANTLQLADTFVHTGGVNPGGPPVGCPVVPIDVTSAGTVPFTLVTTDKSLRGGQELVVLSRSIERLTLNLECHTSAAVGMSSAVGYLSLLKARQRLPSQQAILAGAHIGLECCERVRAIHGVRNMVMFEPRAVMEAIFNMPTEASEFLQRIERIAFADPPGVFTP